MKEPSMSTDGSVKWKDTTSTKVVGSVLYHLVITITLQVWSIAFVCFQKIICTWITRQFPPWSRNGIGSTLSWWHLLSGYFHVSGSSLCGFWVENCSHDGLCTLQATNSHPLVTHISIMCLHWAHSMQSKGGDTGVDLLLSLFSDKTVIMPRCACAAKAYGSLLVFLS